MSSHRFLFSGAVAFAKSQPVPANRCRLSGTAAVECLRNSASPTERVEVDAVAAHRVTQIRNLGLRHERDVALDMPLDQVKDRVGLLI